MTSGSMIDYESLAQEAMRGIVRTVLTRAAKSGLPGDHHFYISFDTGAPGVALSKRLRDKYPSEMTIVLQHRFWDLGVTDERFEVKLTFDGIPERLVVPFAAIKVFFDPSVRYGLQFEGPEHQADGLNAPDAGLVDDEPRPITTRSASPRKPRAAKKRSDKDALEPVASSASTPVSVKPAAAGTPSAVPPQPAATKTQPAASATPGKPPAEAKPLAPVAPAGGAQIVSLDQFRKK